MKTLTTADLNVGTPSAEDRVGSHFGHEMGLVGNVWIRQNDLRGVGASSVGHKHHFDHASLLTKGSVRVYIQGHEPKEFHAPTFIVIKKEFEHKFEALTEEVQWFCVFALRDEYGDVSDMYSGDNSPMGIAANGWTPKKHEDLERHTTQEVE